MSRKDEFLANYGDPDIVLHKNASPHSIIIGLMHNPLVSSKHLEPFLTDKDDHSLRALAIKNSSTTNEQLQRGITDETFNVRESVALNKNATEGHLAQLVDDPSDRVRDAVVKHPNTSDANLEKLSKDKNSFIRARANVTLAFRRHQK